MFWAVAFLGATLLATCVSSRSAAAEASRQAFVYYAVPAQKQYVDNQDDRSRAKGHNPFGNYAFVPQPTQESESGPFAGDEALVTYTLYADAGLHARAGTGTLACHYSASRDSLCDAAYQLRDGTLLGVGEFSFDASGFTFAITGGTGNYRGVSGTLAVAGDQRGSRAAGPLIVQKQRLDFAVRPAASEAPRRIVLYSEALQEQFIDNRDDEARGDVNNPIGYTNAKAAAVVSEHEHGPFAGDEAFYTFKLFRNAKLTESAGSAAFTCEYLFRRDAFCFASYQLSGGSLTGAGTFDFNAKRFTIAITGGTGTVRAAGGEMLASASNRKTQRLVFTLNRSGR